MILIFLDFRLFSRRASGLKIKPRFIGYLSGRFVILNNKKFSVGFFTRFFDQKSGICRDFELFSADFFFSGFFRVFFHLFSTRASGLKKKPR